jgi:FtsP/CotA-like multicopper oxidase with cupredoxin domain
MVSRPGKVAVYPGEATRTWQYHAKVISGDPSRVVDLPGSYLGPIIKVRRGEKIRIRYTNTLPEKSIVHFHGLHVPAIMDGHPRYVISPGQSYLYEFEVKNRAGTYWYHPHPHGRTGTQVYRGMAGLFLVSDDEESALELPSGDYDIPLVIQDRTFDQENQPVYMSGNRMAQMVGFLGDTIVVNGIPDFTLPVSSTGYRLRFLNGSNSRIYRLAWKDGRALTIIGSDGGLLEKPITRQHVFLAPGERIELWADFSDDPAGYETAIVSLPFNAGAGGRMMGRGMMMGERRPLKPTLDLGAAFSICRIKVTKHGEKSRPLPQNLTDVIPRRQIEVGDQYQHKYFSLIMRRMQWTINGRLFQMEDVAEDEIVQLGSSEIWEFDNTGGKMMPMMDMPHPIHLHGKQFRVIERSGVKHNGYVDDGWKDTVLLMPGERIRILVNFDEYPGLFLYHCHNLEHEDMGMMRNYFVRR